MIRERVAEMYKRQTEALRTIEPLLADQGIQRLKNSDLTDAQREYLHGRFTSEIQASIAPVAVVPGESFPFLSSSRMFMCVRLKHDSEQMLTPCVSDEVANDDTAAKEKEAAADDDRDRDRFVVLPLPRTMDRVWTIPTSENYCYMLIEDIIGTFIDDLFEGQEILDWAGFCVTRNGDVELDEDGRSDLMLGMEQMLEARKSSNCIRLEISRHASEQSRAFLTKALNVDAEDVYAINGPLAVSALMAVATVNGFPHLKFDRWPPHAVPPFGPGADVFGIIAESDQLLCHPYQSYEPVVDFIRAAAVDERVIAIKQTLYRTARDSEIARALETAAENGKHVTCIVELKARFDEARNIDAARRLEAAGVDVIYGVRGLKTHAKVCIVVRKEASGVRRYMHFGNGNYNESTARMYGDISLFTCDEQLGFDAVHFFNAITGLSVPQSLGKLAAAPINLRETLLELIHAETEQAKSSGSGLIRLKCNSLVDRELIDALYAASQAGAKVLLNIRGICCLRPGKKGLSENIRVVSIVDRFLEHARIYHFGHSDDNVIYISSADGMGRNLDRRVELMVPVDQKACKSRLMSMLDAYFQDTENASVLQSDGTYVPNDKKKKFRSQKFLYEEAGQYLQARSNARTTVFEPHRGSP